MQQKWIEELCISPNFGVGCKNEDPTDFFSSQVKVIFFRISEEQSCALIAVFFLKKTCSNFQAQPHIITISFFFRVKSILLRLSTLQFRGHNVFSNLDMGAPWSANNSVWCRREIARLQGLCECLNCFRSCCPDSSEVSAEKLQTHAVSLF